ncbi:MAG: hypothetical protein WCR55_11215, partial [Lentisphaerota bacterium]
MKRNIMATLGLIVCLWGINVCADDVQHYMDSAETKNVNGDYIGAVEECNKAIELDPKYEPAYFFRGFIKSRSHDYKGALEDLNKAKELGYYKADVEIKRMQKDNGNTDNQMDKTPNRAKQYRSVMDCIQDGWKYEGESIDGVPNGKGVLTTPDGEDKFEGQFQNGKLVKGSIFMKNRGIL